MADYSIDLSKVFTTGRKSIWDRPVPIVRQDNTYDCYLCGEIEEPSLYNELCFLLENATPESNINIHINTGGGAIDSAFKIVAAIKRSKADVVARLTGTVASAGTIIALTCRDVEVEDYTHFMIHNYSTGTQGKGHEVLDFITFNDKDLKITFKEIYKGFLTDTEIKEVLRGKDMWLTADNVRERWSKKNG